MPYGSPLAYGQGTYKGVVIPPPAPVGTHSRYYFAFMPNWKTPVTISYGFFTAVSMGRRLGEQRRALYDRARRTIRLRVLESSDSPTVQNFVEVNHGNYIFLPLYTEPITVTGPAALQGQTHFDVVSLADYFNLQHLTDYIMAIDLHGDLDAEVMRYASHTETTLNVEDAVSQAYTPARTVMYPAMPAFIESKRLVDETDTIVDYELTFREYY